MMASEEAMVELVRMLVRGLVDDEAAVRVTGVEREGCLMLNVTVAPDDVGKVIGRQGRTARALRTILAAAAMKSGAHCQLNIVETAAMVSKGEVEGCER